MQTVSPEKNDLYEFFHFKRMRLNSLFTEAIKYPIVFVCAGAGYGKSTAVHDFIQDYKAVKIWVQLSERDNIASRFWENFTHSMSKINSPFASALCYIGFPDTTEKLNQYNASLREHIIKQQLIMVFDDCHIIENPAVIRFVENAFLNMPPETTLFLISRSTPKINTAGLISRGCIFDISEDDLRFTKDELFQFFRKCNIVIQPDVLREIMQDTEGWAFAINLIAHSYQKAPAYTGYLRSAIKTNIFRLMETEIWDRISQQLQIFLTQLSLIDHLSVEIITLLADGDEKLITELERQNAYVRLDSYINMYLIHPLFLEFLVTRQRLLSKEQKRKIYLIAGEWCNKNGFKIDALAYCHEIGDYEKIVSIFFELPTQVPFDIAQYAIGIFNKIPADAFDRVNLLAVMHLRTIMGLGLWQEAKRLVELYEEKFSKINDNDLLKNQTLGGIYYCWAMLRIHLCIWDDCYDFDLYFKKFSECLSKTIVEINRTSNNPAGPWINSAGTARKGAPQEYIDAVSRTAHHLSHGTDDLACGELNFYQGDIRYAETLIVRALTRLRKQREFEYLHRALLYTLRIAVFNGDYIKAKQTLKEMQAQLNETDYCNRFVNYDISLAWYYYFMKQPEKIPEWIQENFSPYGHAGFIENFANQVKARYCYLTRNYPPLLSYIHEMKQRESFLFGRVEMLAIEACVHYKMKNKEKACTALAEAYENAEPNDLIMPFIELGKDMRTLTAYVIKARTHKKKVSIIPEIWLESINRKSAGYAKRLNHVIAKHKQASGFSDSFTISPRENDILTDLSQGLSRTEIAASRNLSINTVKMVINNLYMKLGAESLADAIRIAVKRKII